VGGTDFYRRLSESLEMDAPIVFRIARGVFEHNFDDTSVEGTEGERACDDGGDCYLEDGFIGWTF